MAEQPSPIAFGGPQTVANVDVARDRLGEAAASGDFLDIDLTGVTEADLAFVQLLVAVRRSAQASGRGLRFHADGSGAVASALARGGLEAATVLEDLPAKGGQ